MWWKYRKRMLIYDNVHNEQVFSKHDVKMLFKKYKKALFIRYTTQFDKTEQSGWYACLKDDRYVFDLLKSKRKNVVNRGVRNFTVREVKLTDYVQDFLETVNDAYQGYQFADAISFEEAQKRTKDISSLENSFVLGAFAQGGDKLIGYLWCHIIDKNISMFEQKVVRAYEHDGVNAALLFALMEKYNSQYVDQGYYLFDGWRNVLHETNFQDYLIKYFGFRKAFCTLHIVFNPKYAWWLVPMLKTFWLYGPLLRKFFPELHKKIAAIRTMQKIARKT